MKFLNLIWAGDPLKTLKEINMEKNENAEMIINMHAAKIQKYKNLREENENIKIFMDITQGAIETFDGLINSQIERIDREFKDNLNSYEQHQKEMDKLLTMQQAVFNVSKEFGEFVKIRQEKILKQLGI